MKPFEKFPGKLLHRIFLTSLIFHTISCSWLLIGKLELYYNIQGWIEVDEVVSLDQSSESLYLRSLYWTCKTISTVGYGDVTGSTTNEYIFTMVVEVSSTSIAQSIIVFGSVFRFFLNGINWSNALRQCPLLRTDQC